MKNLNISGFLKNKKGITLVELLISFALLGIIMASVYSFFTLQHNSIYSQTIRVKAEKEARTAINMIMDDLRKYESSSSTYDENGNLVKIAKDNTLGISNSILYKVSDGILKRNDESICNNIETFAVSEVGQGYDANIININLKVVVKGKSGSDIVIVVQNSYRRKLSNVK